MEFVILAVVIVLVFGAGWLPKAARNLGRAKVEVDKAQKQFNETKNQLVETTGLDKADAALKKANRTLNQSPQQIVKNATKSAMSPAADAHADANADADIDVEDAEIISRHGPDGEAAASAESGPANQASDVDPRTGGDTHNVDFSD